jgi:peptidoglycan/xylan/chitin deacetylase (PgdA/CDA1 family)
MGVLITHSQRFAQRAKRAVFGAAHRYGLINFPVILMYHRVAVAELDLWDLAVPPILFKEQLSWLKDNRHVLPLGEFGRLHSVGLLPPDAVSITFDDGYACNALVAAPILERFALPATIFLATGYISSEQEFWWDALEHIIFHTTAASLSLSLDDEVIQVVLGPADDNHLSMSDAKESTVKPRQIAYLQCWSKLRLASEDSRRAAMLDLHGQAGVPLGPRPAYRAMTADEVTKLAKSDLIDIGAHGVNHPVLNHLNSAAQQREVEGSRDACHNLCGRRPHAFAYPYGDYDDAVVKVVDEAGFDIACTAIPRAIGKGSNLLRMPRLGVGAWSAAELCRNVRASTPP